MSDPVDEPTTADIITGIRTELATIRRNWAGTFDPPRVVGVQVRTPPKSQPPGSSDAISLRAKVTADLAFWVHAFVDHHPDQAPADQPLDCTDVRAMTIYLSDHAPSLAAWSFAHRLWTELIPHAKAVKFLAQPPRRETTPLGECDECGETVRAKAHDPGNIKCKGCGTVDTIDGWILRIVGHEGLVTAHQLIPILHRRMGVVASREQIRKWKSRGVITSAGVDEQGRTIFDRKVVFLALSRWEHQREASA